MSLDQTTMERLVFVKSLHHEGIEQSRRPMPMAAMSVLTFHDAVELFLYISAEEVDAHASGKIKEYWNDIKQKSGIELFGKPGIARLNRARVGLKHYGNRPDKREIESFRSAVQSFFEENTPKVFDIDYSDVTLAQLVRFDEAQEHIEMADELWGKNKREEAMGDLRLAHKKLLSEHQDRSRWELNYTPLPQFSLSTPLDVSEDVEESFAEVNDTFEAISDALIYSNFGIDYGKYARFHHLTPQLIANHDLESRFKRDRPYLENYDYSELPEGSFEYCMDFVIELALSLQNSDFDFDSEPTPPTNSGLDWDW